MKGFLEFADEFQVRGWAYDPHAEDAVLRIEVSLNGQHLGGTIANLHRDDLEKAGIGRGNHAFILNLPHRLPEADLPHISASVIAPDGRQLELPRIYAHTSEPDICLPQLAFHETSYRTDVTPIFVLGAARSGTTVVTQALRRLSRFEGSEEGHLLDLLAHLSVSLNQFYNQKFDELTRNTMVARVPKVYFDDALDEMFGHVAEKLYNKPFWVEKTPISNSVFLAPRYRKIWPNAKFIFMKRRGIENVRSRKRKFPKVDFTTHCSEWASTMQAWRDVRARLSGCAIEIDQQYVAEQPQAAGAYIGAFLGLERMETERISEFFASERPQRTRDNLLSPGTTGEAAWDQSEWAIFNEICGETMLDYHYGSREQYYDLADISQMVRTIE